MSLTRAESALHAHAVGRRGRDPFEVVDRRDLESEPVRIAKSDHGTRETRERPVDVDAPLGEPNHPAVQGFSRHREGHGIDHAAAAAAAAGRHERKERENRAGMSRRVAVIEMIGAGVVEVDRLLDQSKAEKARVEVDIGLGVDGDCRHVVKAANGFSLGVHLACSTLADVRGSLLSLL